MNVTREIVKDLLPLYVAGEASSDSRVLVEAFLREDPELRRLEELLRREDPALAGEPAPPTSGRAALERTRALLRRRTWLLALALFLTALPLSCYGDDGGLRFLLMRDAPVVGSTFLALAAAFWIAYGVTVRRMRVPGL